MKIVYIAHPIGRDQWQKTINLGNIKRIVREINLKQPDIVPFVPYYCDCEALRDDVPQERAKGLKNGQTLLNTCPIHELWLYGDKISEGMQAEIKTAFILGVPVIPKTWQTQEAYKEIYYKEIQGINDHAESRICKGDLSLGTACGKCSRCKSQLSINDLPKTRL